MKLGSWAKILLAATPLMVGCGNFWQAPSSGGGTTTCTSNCPSSGNFYILNSGTTPEIVGETISSGTLSTISGSPWTLDSTPYSMAIAPSGNYLYVSMAAGVYVFPISSGVLSTGVQISTDQAYAIQIDTTGEWLLEAIAESNGVTLAAIKLSTSTGENTGATSSAYFAYKYNASTAGVQQNQMAISADNKYIFQALGTGGTLVVPFNSANPLPSGVTGSAIKVLHSSGAALSVAVDPSSTPALFYIGETLGNSDGTSGGLRAFDYSTLGGTTLTQATGSPMATGKLAPAYILPLATPDYVYVANGSGTLAGFALTSATSGSTTTYTLTAGSTATIGSTAEGLAADSTGSYLLSVSSGGSPYFDAFTFDSTTTGTLDSAVSSSSQSYSIAIVAAP